MYAVMRFNKLKTMGQVSIPRQRLGCIYRSHR